MINTAKPNDSGKRELGGVRSLHAVGDEKSNTEAVDKTYRDLPINHCIGFQIGANFWNLDLRPLDLALPEET